MSKYTVFFVIRCSAADMIPEAFRRCGRNRGDETDSDGRAEAVPRPFRRPVPGVPREGCSGAFGGVLFIPSSFVPDRRTGIPLPARFFVFPVRLAAAAGGSGAGRFPSDASFSSGLRARGRRNVLVRGPVRMCADRFAAEGPGFCRGGIRILSREDSFVSIILIYFALI